MEVNTIISEGKQEYLDIFQKTKISHRPLIKFSDINIKTYQLPPDAISSFSLSPPLKVS